MSKRHQIIKHTFIYTLANQITQVIAIVAGILTRNFLGPVQMGMWATLQMALQYSAYSSLGTTQGITREIPYYLGKQNQGKADEIKNLVSSFQVLTAVIAALAIWSCAFIFKNKLPIPIFYGLLGIGLLIVLERINGFLIALLRAYKELKLISKQLVASAIVNLVLVGGLTYFFKLYGFVAAMALSYVFNILYNRYHFDFKLQFLLSRKILEIVYFGFPLMLLSVLETFLKGIDKIMMVKMLGFEALGLYTVALMASNFLSSLPNAVAVIIIPHFEEKYGERDSISDLTRYTEQTASALAKVLPLVIGAAWILMPVFVHFLLPQYTSGIWPAQILILGSFFVALSLPYNVALVTLKKHLWIFPVHAITIGLSALGIYIVIKSGLGIAGVAFIMILSFALNCSLILSLAGIFLYRNFLQGLKNLFRHTFWFTIILSTLIMLEFVRMDYLLFRYGLRLILFLIISVPLISRLTREYDLLKLLKFKTANTNHYG